MAETHSFTKSKVIGGLRFFTVTARQLEALLRDPGNIGLCLACGAEKFGVEPDARECPCLSCEKTTVYGVEDLLISGRIHKR